MRRSMRVAGVLIALGAIGMTVEMMGDAERATAAGPTAAFRIIHLSSDSPDFDFCNNGKLFAKNVGYGETSKYKKVGPAPAENSFQRYWAGQGCIEGAELNTAAFQVNENGALTAVAIGSINTNAGGYIGPPALIAFDDLSAPDAGFAKVRFFNLVINAMSSVKLEIGGTEVVADVAPITTQTVVLVPTYHNVATGKATVQVKNDLDEVKGQATDFKFKKGGVYTIWFHGDAGGTRPFGPELSITQDNKRKGKFVKTKP